MDALLAARWPNLSSVLFGHVGDGNLHLNFVAPAEVTPADFARAQAEASDAAYLMVRDFGGSISAEHGIGSHKLESFHGLESPQQLDLMRTVKAALDPQGLMNPGKVFRTVD
jgi:FAD/FMN-containing dehydrogenase